MCADRSAFREKALTVIEKETNACVGFGGGLFFLSDSGIGSQRLVHKPMIEHLFDIYHVRCEGGDQKYAIKQLIKSIEMEL
jgi:hypothetical protein